jgi:hypothetical protein
MRQGWVWLSVALWCGLSLLAAAFVRYAWIEAVDVAAPCDAGAGGLICTLRAWIIQAFVHQRLGWAALGSAAFAFVLQSSWAASAALFLACSGLVLYSTELSAPAALLAALIFANVGQAATVAKLKSSAP